MAITFTTGNTFANGDSATAQKLNNVVNAMTIAADTDNLLGRQTAGNGAIEQIPCPSFGRTLIANTAASGARTTLGLGSIATQAANGVAISGGSVQADQYACNPTALTYGANVTLDFSTAAASVQTLALTGNVTFITSNLTNGATKLVRITSDSSTRNFTFPGSWTFLVNPAPASIAANKTALLSLISFGSSDGSVLANYIAQP